MFLSFFTLWDPTDTLVLTTSVHKNQIPNSSFSAITNKHVKYWTSIITSNVHQINLSNENMKNKHWCFQIFKTVSQKNHFGILIYILPWEHLFEIYFRLLRRNNKLKINNFLTNIWRNNWRFNIWRRKRTLLYCIPPYKEQG